MHACFKWDIPAGKHFIFNEIVLEASYEYCRFVPYQLYANKRKKLIVLEAYYVKQFFSQNDEVQLPTES